IANRIAMCSASFSSVGLSEDSEGACAAKAESAWLTVKRARRGKVESRDWKGSASSLLPEASLVRAICPSICKIPFSSSSCSVINPVSTAMDPAPARADRLPRIPAVALPQRLGAALSTSPPAAPARFQPRVREPPVVARPEPPPRPPEPPLPPDPLAGPEPDDAPAPPAGPSIETPFSALPFPDASLAPPLLNQKPAVSGDSGVPPSLPP